MSSDSSSQNAYLNGPVSVLFFKTAMPIIFVMSMSGFLTVADAILLGIYVGPDAVGAVTSVFPIYMLLVALSVLVSGGMSSLLARHLGAGRFDEARAVMAGAHALALAISGALIVLFLVLGDWLVLGVTNGSGVLYPMAYAYIGIVICAAPLQFVLAVQGDALRCEGRAGLMALMSLFVSLANVGFNILLIVGFGLGVAGSALGTALAQGVAVAMLVAFRAFGRTQLPLRSLVQRKATATWSRIIALGAPPSLGFVGIAGISATIIAALQMTTAGDSYDTVISAYGIITRITTFTFLPILGLSQAMQALVGNNLGAGLLQRSDASLRFGLLSVFCYCLVVEGVLVGAAGPTASMFVSDQGIVDEVARIMPLMVALYFVSGPLILIAGYFQAIGDAGRAAVLGLAKPYLFTMPLIVILALALGQHGMWLAMATADALLLIVTVIVLARNARARGWRWGLFMHSGRATAEAKPI